MADRELAEEPAMATKRDDLSKHEQRALQRAADHLSVSPATMEILKELGLVEEKLGGGLGLSKAGRVLLSKHAASVQRSIRKR
jgi:hypothetical protein